MKKILPVLAIVFTTATTSSAWAIGINSKSIDIPQEQLKYITQASNDQQKAIQLLQENNAMQKQLLTEMQTANRYNSEILNQLKRIGGGATGAAPTVGFVPNAVGGQPAPFGQQPVQQPVQQPSQMQRFQQVPQQLPGQPPR